MMLEEKIANELKQLPGFVSIKEEIDPELDFIVIARPSVKGLTYDEVRSNLVHVLKLAKIIDREEKSK